VEELFKNALFRKQLLLILFIVLLYTSLIAIIFSYKSYEMLTIKNEYFNHTYINTTGKATEYKLGVASNYINNLMQNEYFHEYINDDEINYYHITRLYYYLTGGTTSVEELGFYIAFTKYTDDFMVSSIGTFSINNYLKQLSIDPDQINGVQELFESRKTGGAYYLVPENMNLNDSELITIIYMEKYSAYEDPIYFFITFDKKRLMPDYLPNNIGLFAIGDADSYHSFRSKSYQDYAFIPSSFVTRSKEDNTFIAENNHKDISYSFESASLPGYQYTYVIQGADAIKLNTQLSSSFIIIIVLMLCLDCIVVFLVTKKSYLPIKLLLKFFIKKEDNKKNDNDKSKQFDELDYIVQQIESINESNLKLQEIFHDSLPTLQEKFLKNILYGIPQEENIPLSDLNLQNYQSGGTLTLLSLDGISELESNLNKKNILSLRGKILNSFNQLHAEVDYLLIPIDYKKFCLVFSEKDTSMIQDVLKQIICLIEKDFSLDITFSISRPVDQIYQFETAYQEAITLINDRYLYLDSKIINYEMMPAFLEEDYIYSIEEERLLISAIKQNDIKKAQLILTDILTKNLEQSTLDVYNIIKLKYALLNTVKRILNHYNKSLLAFSKKNEEIFSFLNSNDPIILHQAFRQIFQSIFDNYIMINDTIENPTVISIISYIHKHYTEDLSLSDISEKFSLTEGYISKLLKDSINISFKSYLNSLKINKSKELLQMQSYTVTEVSNMVGCINVNTFIRMFKRFEGVSPGEYLKSL